MGRNPKGSKWYATPKEARKRTQIAVTISAEAHAALDAMAGPGARSALVERLILEEYEKKGSRR